MTVDQDRQLLYISDFDNNKVRRVNIRTNETTTVASGIDRPMGIAVDVLSVPRCVYVASFGQHVIYKIVVDDSDERGPGVVSVFAGSLGQSGYRDGSLLGSGLQGQGLEGAQFMNPMGLALDYFHGVMIVGDSFYSETSRISNGRRVYTKNFKYSLRKISLLLGNVSTLAGKSGVAIDLGVIRQY